MAAILSTSGTDSGFTFDHNGLEKTILSLKVNRLYQHDPNDCPNVDYYQGDLIVNKEDPTALDAATSDALARANLDPSMCRVAVQLALAAVYALAGHPKQYVQVRLAGGRVLTGTISNANNDTFLVRSHILGDGHTVRYDQLAEPPRPVLAIGTKAVKGLEVTGIVALCIVAIPLFVALYPLIRAGVIPD
jgi:hypothetical protein